MIMSRESIVKIHLMVASAILPFLFLMPISGTLYLLGFKGTQTQDYKFTINGRIPESDSERVDFFRDVFQIKKLDFSFEYIKTKGNKLVFRPSSRTHYMAEFSENEALVYLMTPNLPKMIMELHKGHGPGIFKKLETVFGIGLLFMTLSGLILGITYRPLRKNIVYSFCAGSLIFIFALLF